MKGCATRQNYKFEGKERDGETGNDDFGARYYTSRLGRWLSADWSAVPAPVPYANPTNPQTLNLYAMVSDNPETFADLDGHCAEDLCILEGSAGVVVGLYVGGAAVLAGGGAYLNTPSGQRSLSTFTSAASTSISNSVHNIENFFTKSDKPAPTKPYDTGQAKDLKGNSQVGDGLDVHHVPQSQPASQTVEGYNKETAPRSHCRKESTKQSQLKRARRLDRPGISLLKMRRIFATILMHQTRKSRN